MNVVDDVTPDPTDVTPLAVEHTVRLLESILRQSASIVLFSAVRNGGETEARKRYWFATLDELLADWPMQSGAERELPIQHISAMLRNGAIYPERCSECYEVKAQCICGRICAWCDETDCTEPECAALLADAGEVL